MTIDEVIELLKKTVDENYKYTQMPTYLVGKILEKLAEKEPLPAELEGGGSTWWYVCGDCHGAIGPNDHYCRHCGRKVSWE